MTIEQTEQAAREAAILAGYNPKLIADIPGRILYETAFAKGAEWRINSVWHGISETPIEGKLFLVYNENDDAYTVRTDSSVVWYKLVCFCKIIRWAYIEDLLPTGGGEG